MGELFASGHVVDVILLVLALDLALLLEWRRRRSRPLRAAALILAVLPGIFLLLSLRAALTGAGWPSVAIWLTLSFPAHLADLWRREG